MNCCAWMRMIGLWKQTQPRNFSRYSATGLPAEIRSENKALQDRLHRTTVTAR